MLAERGGVHDFVKVLDFGIVKHVDAPEDPELTAQDSIMGTPAYIAPEQVTERGDVDERSDLYLVGGVAYFMLTGTEMFRGRSVMEILAQHVQAPPEPPSQRVEGIPNDLEELVLSLLSKKPDDRPRSARTLTVLLGRLGDAHGWDADRARGWWNQFGEAARGNETLAAATKESQTILTIDLAAR
jgi:serine/threonine-protein kinase